MKFSLAAIALLLASCAARPARVAAPVTVDDDPPPSPLLGAPMNAPPRQVDAGVSSDVPPTVVSREAIHLPEPRANELRTRVATVVARDEGGGAVVQTAVLGDSQRPIVTLLTAEGVPLGAPHDVLSGENAIRDFDVVFTRSHLWIGWIARDATSDTAVRGDAGVGRVVFRARSFALPTRGSDEWVTAHDFVLATTPDVEPHIHGGDIDLVREDDGIVVAWRLPDSAEYSFTSLRGRSSRPLPGHVRVAMEMRRGSGSPQVLTPWLAMVSTARGPAIPWIARESGRAGIVYLRDPDAARTVTLLDDADVPDLWSPRGMHMVESADPIRHGEDDTIPDELQTVWSAPAEGGDVHRRVLRVAFGCRNAEVYLAMVPYDPETPSTDDEAASADATNLEAPLTSPDDNANLSNVLRSIQHPHQQDCGYGGADPEGRCSDAYLEIGQQEFVAWLGATLVGVSYDSPQTVSRWGCGPYVGE